MKILLPTYEYPPDLGGVSEYLGGLFGELRDVDVMRLRMPKLPLVWLTQLPKLWMAARKHDLVGVSHVLPLGISAALLGRPYIIIVHGLDLRMAAATPIKKMMAKRALGGAKLIIANSHATAAELARFDIDPAVALVLTPCPPAGFDVKFTRDEARKDLGFEGKKVVLGVGRLVHRKGFDRLIGMLPALRASCGDVVLIIAGTGSEEGKLRSAITAAGLEPHVRLVIAPDRAALAKLYASADVFAMPARATDQDIEGFGIVFLEAALFGLPTIASKTGGTPEAVEEGVTGILIDPKSDAEFTEALAVLLNDPERAKRMGESGRVRVNRDFHWKNRAETFMGRLA